MKRILLLSLLALIGCDSPTEPDYSMVGEWGIEGYAPAEGCDFYAFVALTGTRSDFNGSGVDGRQDRVVFDTLSLSVDGESGRHRLHGSFECGGTAGLWSMWKYAR